MIAYEILDICFQAVRKMWHCESKNVPLTGMFPDIKYCCV